jgi:hypothetical protein
VLLAPPVRRLVADRDALRVALQRSRKRNARLARRVQDLQTEVRALREASRRPHRTGASDSFEDAGLGYLFIATYGRSGSTLLQGILDSIPGYLIRGENGGVVYQLFRFHSAASRHRDKHGSRYTRRPSDAWYGIHGYRSDVALRGIRRLVLATLIRPARDSRVVGFKDIRWTRDDLDEYVDFLRAAFPGARFIVNTRDHSEVARSRWWADREDAPEQLADVERRLLALHARLGPASYHVHYNDYVEEPGRLAPLFAWLGEEFDAARVAEVMAVRHSY